MESSDTWFGRRKYRYDAAGTQTGTKLVTLRAGTTYPTDRSAYLAGRPSYQLTGAGLSGCVGWRRPRGW